MPFVILLIFVFGSALVAWFMPQLRVAAIGVLVLFGGLLGYLFFSTTSEPARQAELIPLNEVSLSKLNFSLEPSPTRLTGNILNGSDRYRLRNVEIRVTLHDCPDEDAALSDCLIIADDTGSVTVNIPSGQLRGFSMLLQFTDLPEVEGVVRWHYDVISTRATD